MNSKFILVLFLTFLINTLFSQTENCSFKSTFKQPPGRILDEDYKIQILELIESYKDEYLSEANKRTLIIHFYFDETNKFHKTVDQFRSLLKDSLKLPTDINIIYKFQKTRGSVFINNGTDQLSVIHLNALIYSKDQNLLKELFGNGKSSRIDTTSTKLKSFSHEFVPFTKVSDEENGYLFLYRGKLVGKGFACDPNEDVDIVNTFKKIYEKKYIIECEKKSEQEAKERKDSLLKTLQFRNDSLAKVLEKYQRKNEKSPSWSLFSNFDFLVGGTSSYSNFTNDHARYRGQGISTSSGVCFFKNGSDKSGFLLTGAINIGSSNYELKRNVDYEFVNSETEYNSISLLQGYNERVNSSFINIPLGIGYQLREKEWPIFFQFNFCGILGFNKIRSNNGNGVVNYRRFYNDVSILVTEQPQQGLEDNVILNGNPEYNSKVSMTFGAKADTKILYNFKNSPINGFLNIGFIYARSKTNSNGSIFISEYKNDFNSILNSTKSLGSLPVFVGLGISYDLRNKINMK